MRRIRKRLLGVAALLVIVGTGVAWQQSRDTATGAGLRTITVGVRPVAMATDPRTRHILVVNGGDLVHPGSVSTLDARTGAVVRTSTVGIGARTSTVGIGARSIAVDANSGHAFVAAGGVANGEGVPIGAGSLSMLDTRSGRVVRAIPLVVPAAAVAVASGAGHAFVIGGSFGKSGRVLMLDTRSGRVLHSVTVAPDPMAVAVDDTRGHVFVVCAGIAPHAGTVSMLDARSGAVLRTVSVGAFPGYVVVDARTGRVFVANEGYATPGGNISMLDAASGTVLRTVTTGINPSVMAVDGRAGRIFVETNTRHLNVLDARSGNRLLDVDLGAYTAPDAALEVDQERGRAILASSSGAYVFDTRGGAARRIPAARGNAMALDAATGRAFIANLDTERQPSEADRFIGWLFGRKSTPGSSGLVGAHSQGVVSVLDPVR